MFDQEAIKQLQKADAIRAASEAISNGAGAIVALPSDFELRDLERYLPAPRRATGVMRTGNLDHFARYVRERARDGAAVFAEDLTAAAVLNLGTREAPGHADDKAIFDVEYSVAWNEWRDVDGSRMTQQETAEFFEDWESDLVFSRGDVEIPAKQAIAAVRSVKVEQVKRGEHNVESLRASRSKLESIDVDPTEQLPTHVVMTLQPAEGFRFQSFTMRLAVSVRDDDVRLILRTIKSGEIKQSVEDEFIANVSDALGGDLPVIAGTFKR